MMTHYRSIFISDVHLGTRGSMADDLCEFLKGNTCDYLYLVGDIIDGWRLKSSVYWPQSHTNVIRKILTKSKRGTEVYYITGNHDEFLRNFLEFDLRMGNITVCNHKDHHTQDGRTLWVTHGDLYDGITVYHKWVAILGDIGYNVLLWANRHYNYFRRKFGLGYWSLSAFTKHKVKQAVNFINKFESAIATDTNKHGYDGVICGHIHNAEIKNIQNITYYNCGDWVESGTALVEHHNGEIELIKWDK